MPPTPSTTMEMPPIKQERKRRMKLMFNESRRGILLLLILIGSPALAGKKGKKKKHTPPVKKEKQRTDQKEIKAQFDYSFNDVSDSIVTVSCESARGRSSGSAFIAKMDGKVFLFTNQHVILGAEKISFKTTTGKTIRPRGVQLSTTRDIARLPIEETDGLEISKNMKLKAPIAVFGNSEGGGVATELFGEITRIDSDVIEVSAEFVSGNSGSPVLNLDREAIGIASYVSWNTSDETGSKTRRYCYRLTDNRWSTVNWKKYNDQYGTLYRDTEELIDSIYDVVKRWGTNPFNRMNADEHRDSGLRKWSTSHNHMINRIARQSEKGTATSHQLENVNKLIRKDMSDSAEDLSSVCRSRARHMKLLANQKELTGFLKNAFNELAEQMEDAAIAIDNYGKELSDFDYFHFKNDVLPF